MSQGNDCIHIGAEKCELATAAAEEAAEKAVKKVFAIQGVDVNDPKQVNNYQQTLNFASRMKDFADKGKLAAFVVIVTTMAGYFIAGLFNR